MQINVMSNEEISKGSDTISDCFSSWHLIHTFHRVHTLDLNNHKTMEVVFEMDSPSSRELATTPQNTQQPMLPYLTHLHLRKLERMSHVWKCNWSEFLIPYKQPLQSSSFYNLTEIDINECGSMKYLFSPHMARFLSNLKKVCIHSCDVIEEVVSNRDDEDEGRGASTSTNTINGFFPHLDDLSLNVLPNLKHIGGAGAKGGSNEIFSNTTTTSTSIHDEFKVCLFNSTLISIVSTLINTK